MIRLAILVVLLILALSFFGISIESIVNSPAGQQNIAYVSGILTDLWNWIVATVEPVTQLVTQLWS